MNKLVRHVALFAYIVVAAFSTNASAATVIDFQTGPAGVGGTITEFAPDHVVGSDINISLMILDGTKIDGAYAANAFLNFDTQKNIIEISGVVDISKPVDPVKAVEIIKPCIGCGGTQIKGILLEGSFSDWSFNTIGSNGVFTATGPDWKSPELLKYIGVKPGTPFEYFGFSVESINGTVISTDIINTVVPVPAAVWLFGSGLIGLIGVARRKKA